MDNFVIQFAHQEVRLFLSLADGDQ